jgi:hypothetical protein
MDRAQRVPDLQPQLRQSHFDPAEHSEILGQKDEGEEQHTQEHAD